MKNVFNVSVSNQEDWHTLGKTLICISFLWAIAATLSISKPRFSVIYISDTFKFDKPIKVSQSFTYILKKNLKLASFNISFISLLYLANLIEKLKSGFSFLIAINFSNTLSFKQSSISSNEKIILWLVLLLAH